MVGISGVLEHKSGNISFAHSKTHRALIHKAHCTVISAIAQLSCSIIISADSSAYNLTVITDRLMLWVVCMSVCDITCILWITVNRSSWFFGMRVPQRPVTLSWMGIIMVHRWKGYLSCSGGARLPHKPGQRPARKLYVRALSPASRVSGNIDKVSNQKLY